MGRAKLKMELIKKDKSRHVAFKKRKEGLIRKMHEFTTLCDVDACMIIYGPKQENGPPVEPEIWPQEPEDVHRIIKLYKDKKEDSGNKTFGLKDFFLERKKKIEDELSKLRKKNMDAKYPTALNADMKKWTEGQLRQFAAELHQKAEYVRAKIESLKGSPNKQGVVLDTNNFMHFGNPRLNGQVYPPPTHVPIHYPSTIDHQYRNPNSMMMLLMNGGDQFGGGSSSGGNFQSATSFKSQVYYEGSSSVGSGARYYGQPLPLPPPSYMVAPPELQLPMGWENYDGSYQDIIQYQMKNDRG